MTAARDFGAKRNSAFWGVQAAFVACDGALTCSAVRGVTAAAARQTARNAGWRVGVKNPGGKPRDFCPNHVEGADT